MWAQQGQDTFGGDGGGFMSSSFSSPSAAAKGDKGVRKQVNLFPVTIRQIVESPDENLKIHESDVQTVTVVGIIRRVDISTTRVSYTLDDHTGSIEALSYVGPEESPAEHSTILLEGTYGRIVGSLRLQRDSGQKYILIYKAFPVTDLNEVTCHNLEVVQVPLKLKQLRELESSKTGVGFGGSNFTNTMVGGGMGFGGTVGTKVSAGNSQAGGLKPAEARVLAYIKADISEGGVGREQLVTNLGIGRQQLNEILDTLGGEGHIYSTSDDDHFKSTD